MDRQIFTVYIDCHESHETKCGGTIYRQILFDGFAEGPEFKGRILSGGVDTQVITENGSGTLSARYTLEGTDKKRPPLPHLY